MNVKTIESNFEYQVEQIFKSMFSDYKEEMETSNQILSFSDWLWKEKEQLGETFFNKVDEFCGVDEITEKYNIEQNER